MISRFSHVTTAYVNSIGISSVFQIGDSMQVKPSVKVLAVQREEERYYGTEGDLSQYQIFEEEIPQPLFYEQLTTNFFHENPKINVQTINIIALSSSAVFQIGSTRDIICETRTKHIRHYKD
ncbi:spore germination protein GerPE [Metabacillus litoralis]|jgi:spore germination protein PE|uniref:spore germination protein GerPE n=1 Tax=Metabacillus litoralis TaxID=152268 RepID=UPI00203A66E0|nr:spore germination protein GerPE [Metabacillus litoralis]MCM3651143.1 spore germination protein GerPE [Metabacillus litoralis]